MIDRLNQSTSQTGLQPVLRSGRLEIDAIAVHHLSVPALAYGVRHDGKTIVFAGDQSFLSEDFAEVLRGSQPDILVMRNVISLAEGQPRGLHRDNRSIGQAAKALSPKLLMLSHNMQRALRDQVNDSVAIGENYTGAMVIAADLGCFAIERASPPDVPYRYSGLG